MLLHFFAPFVPSFSHWRMLCRARDGRMVRAALRIPFPSGAATGSREALELRDGARAAISGRAVTKAVAQSTLSCAARPLVATLSIRQQRIV